MTTRTSDLETCLQRELRRALRDAIDEVLALPLLARHTTTSDTNWLRQWSDFAPQWTRLESARQSTVSSAVLRDCPRGPSASPHWLKCSAAF